MNKLNLVSIAKDILQIELWKSRVLYDSKHDYEIEIFQQWWGNTSGGFEGIGGCAMTRQTTYVLHDHNKAHVFFNGEFAYSIEMNIKFIEDLKVKNIAGKQSYKKRYGIN